MKKINFVWCVLFCSLFVMLYWILDPHELTNNVRLWLGLAWEFSAISSIIVIAIANKRAKAAEKALELSVLPISK